HTSPGGTARFLARQSKPIPLSSFSSIGSRFGSRSDMPAYSGGNRWVGVVSLKEPPVAVPLHKMAAIKQSLSRLGRITVAPGKLMSVRQVCRVLQRLAERHAL